MKIIIDIASLSGIQSGGDMLSPQQLLEIGRDTGVYIYNGRVGNKPIVVKDDIKILTSDSTEAQNILRKHLKK